jgi:hypothetical protein
MHIDDEPRGQTRFDRVYPPMTTQCITNTGATTSSSSASWTPVGKEDVEVL